MLVVVALVVILMQGMVVLVVGVVVDYAMPLVAVTQLEQAVQVLIMVPLELLVQMTKGVQAELIQVVVAAAQIELLMAAEQVVHAAVLAVVGNALPRLCAHLLLCVAAERLAREQTAATPHLAHERAPRCVRPERRHWTFSASGTARRRSTCTSIEGDGD